MTEKEKMTAGKIYDPSDEELVKLRTKAHRLSKEYNELLETDEKRSEILKEMGIIGDSFYLQGPVQFDYGCLTSIGANSYANFNYVCGLLSGYNWCKCIYGTKCVTSYPDASAPLAGSQPISETEWNTYR